MQPLLKLARAQSDVAVARIAFPATVACGSHTAGLGHRRAPRFRISDRYCGFGTGSVDDSFWSIKMFSDDVLFGMPVVAPAALRPSACSALATPAAQAIAVLLAPAAISASVAAVVHAAVARRSFGR